ncbi:hypothetical protein PCANB_000610 [Pneumocystis canis]|nr:hypothetical protein PCANB_000610 [Pneumocystis canis]
MSLDRQHQSLNLKTKPTISLVPYKPCGKGKAKIAMKYREDKRQRQITASKRLPGLMKKAAQYSELTGAKVVVLVRDEQRRVYRYCSDGEINIEKSANRMLTDPAEKVFTTEQCFSASNENTEKNQTTKSLTYNNLNSQEHKKNTVQTTKNVEEFTKFENQITETLMSEENHINTSESNYHNINEKFSEWPIKLIRPSTYSTLLPQLYEMKTIESTLSLPYDISNTVNSTNICGTLENSFNYYSNLSNLNPSNFENEGTNFINSEILWYPEKLKAFNC